MNKRKTLVLSIGFTLILLTCITFVILLIYDCATISEVDDQVFTIFCFFLFAFPIILEELTLLISVYKLINFRPRIAAKICYILSVVIVVVALIFQLLVFTKIITPNMLFSPEGGVAPSSRLVESLLLTLWTVPPISFALGCVTSSKKKD